MAQLAAELPDGRKFDAIIVDEAQDFAEDWWVPLLGALKDPEEGGLYVYSDENQKVFARFGRPPVALVPLVLDHNLRNTRQIAESFGPLAPMRMRPMGGDGPEVEFVHASADDALAVADDQVERLLDDGWPTEHVALITTGARHPEQNSRQDGLGQEGYWRTFWESDDVFYGHVLGCKGLERRAVVLCLNEDGSRDRARERLYVGMSRATDELVVVGGGDAVGVARLVRSLPEARELAPQARCRVIVNKVRAAAIGLAPERAVHETLRRLAQVTPEACWPFDGRAADVALLEGRPLVDVAGRSRLRRRVQELAVALAPAEAPASRASLRAAERPRRRWLPALR